MEQQGFLLLGSLSRNPIESFRTSLQNNNKNKESTTTLSSRRRRPISASPTPSSKRDHQSTILSNPRTRVTSDELKYLAAPGSGDILTISDTTSRRALLEGFITSEVDAISTRVNDAVYSFNCNHPLAMNSNSHESIREIHTTLENIFRSIDDGKIDRDRVMYDLQAGIGAIVRRNVLEDRAKRLKKTSSKTSSRRGSNINSTADIDDDIIQSRLIHVDEIIERCQQTFADRANRSGQSREDLAILDSFISEATINYDHDQLNDENTLDDMDDDPGAPISVLNTAMSSTALRDMIAKANKSTTSIKLQLESIFATVTGLLRGNETTYQKNFNDLQLKMRTANEELLSLQKNLEESSIIIRDMNTTIDNLNKLLRLRDAALEKCMAQLQDSQRLVKKLETEKEIMNRTNRHIIPSSNVNLDSKMATESASKSTFDAKATTDRSSAQYQKQIADLQKKLAESEARERALQSKLLSFTEELEKQSRQQNNIHMSTLSQSTSQASSQAITQAAAQHERTLSENNTLLSKISTMDKEINDLKDKLALLMEKLRDTDIKLKNSEEEQRKLKSMEPRSDLQQTIPTISSTLSSSSFSALSFSTSNVVLAVPVVESTNLSSPSINQGHNSIGVISKQTEDNLAKATTTDLVSSQKIAAELGSEIERLRKQLLAANRDAAEMKNTVASLQKKKAFDKDLVKKGIQVFASTQTDFDLHQQVEVNPPKDKDASSIQTPLKTRKTSAAPSRVLPDVEKISNNTLLSLHPTYRVNIDGVKDPNASYSVVGTDTELVNLSHHTERSLNDSYSDRRVDDSPRILKLHAPKGGSPLEADFDDRPFSPVSASTALKEASRTHVEEERRFRGISYSIPIQKTPEALAVEALSIENIRGFKEAIEILGRHLYVIRRFGGKSGSSDWMSDVSQDTQTSVTSPSTLTFTDLIERIEDINFRVAHPLQNLHGVFKRASEARHGSILSKAVNVNSPISKLACVDSSVSKISMAQTAPVFAQRETTSLTKPMSAVPIALLQQALTPIKSSVVKSKKLPVI